MPFPIKFQYDTMMCGVTCLQMICKYLGKDFSIEYLSKLCFATSEGVSMLGLRESAKTLGLKTICTSISLKDIELASLPCILYWNQNHFVVLYKVKKRKKFYIADPGKGLMI